jgi:site-specific recombinase XerC
MKDHVEKFLRYLEIQRGASQHTLLSWRNREGTGFSRRGTGHSWSLRIQADSG